MLPKPGSTLSLVASIVVTLTILITMSTIAMRAVRRRIRATAELELALEEANHARRDAVEHAERLRFLDEASSILASSLDYETTVAAAARLVVPDFADWCSVDVLVKDEIKQIAASHIETPELQHMSDVRARYNLEPDGPTGVAKVIRTGETQYIPEVTDAFLVSQARSPEHLAAIRKLNVRSVMIVPMGARGHIIGALSLVRVGSARPFSESSLAMARDLARRAAVAIDNAELYHAAVVANESKATFLATMSHELRTPLTAIIGYDELLADGISGEINDAQRKQLERIMVSAKQLLSLIEDILLHARLDAGRESVGFDDVVAKRVVDEAITSVLPAAEARHVTLAADAIDERLALRTDNGRLRQMLVNLIANGVKFTEGGSVNVRALARGSDVVFEVQDTGIGIAPENLEHIFEPFWQVEQKKTRRVGGTGLGLSTTRRLARLLGGDVTVESQPYVGSTFRIVLPKTPLPDHAARQNIAAD